MTFFPERLNKQRLGRAPGGQFPGMISPQVPSAMLQSLA